MYHNVVSEGWNDIIERQQTHSDVLHFFLSVSHVIVYHIVVSEGWNDAIEGQQILRDVLNFLYL